MDYLTAMTEMQMLSGHFVGRDHHFAVRVYFEDTDFSGLVYHANYLKFLERARSDMLKRAGIMQRAMFEGGEGVYAITEINIRYKAPARFDDDLLILSTVEGVRPVGCTIHQRVMRDGQLLVEAEVKAAFLSPQGRPKRQPALWIAAFERLLKE
jgi:acyl-CoA thioester hydrolase